MSSSPSAASSAGERLAQRRESEPTEGERRFLADLHNWRTHFVQAAPYRGSDDASGRPALAQAQADAQVRADWLGSRLPALQGLYASVTRAAGQPLSNRVRDELLGWPLSVRASLLRCSADFLQSRDPRGSDWAPCYRFHAELARALADGECHTAQEQRLQARVILAVREEALNPTPVTRTFPGVVNAVRAIFTQASQGDEAAGQGIPAFRLSIDPLIRRQASYNPFTRMVHIGPQFLDERYPMPYVLRHVAAASMHFYNHRLIDAVAANERRDDNPDRQIGSMLYALQQVPITAEALTKAGLTEEQAKLVVRQTLPSQRELAFARAVKDAWESGKRDALDRAMVQGGARPGAGTIAQQPASVTPASVTPASAVATVSQALALTAPTALTSAATTATRVWPADAGEGLGIGDR